MKNKSNLQGWPLHRWPVKWNQLRLTEQPQLLAALPQKPRNKFCCSQRRMFFCLLGQWLSLQSLEGFLGNTFSVHTFLAHLGKYNLLYNFPSFLEQCIMNCGWFFAALIELFLLAFSAFSNIIGENIRAITTPEVWLEDTHPPPPPQMF